MHFSDEQLTVYYLTLPACCVLLSHVGVTFQVTLISTDGCGSLVPALPAASSPLDRWSGLGAPALEEMQRTCVCLVEAVDSHSNFYGVLPVEEQKKEEFCRTQLNDDNCQAKDRTPSAHPLLANLSLGELQLCSFPQDNRCSHINLLSGTGIEYQNNLPSRWKSAAISIKLKNY